MLQGRVKELTANKRYLFFANLFTELKFLNAIIQLFYLSRGLNVGQIVLLSVIWSFSTLLSELPSSVLADVVGRKRTMAIGILLMAIGNLVTLFAYGFVPVSLGVIFLAFGYAFTSGTDEAILYDTLKELKQESYATKISGKFFSSGYLAKIFTPLLGSLVARDLISWQFSLLICFDLLGTILALIFVLKLTEPQRILIDTNRQKMVLKETWALLTKNAILLKYSLNKIGIFLATLLYWRVYQIFLQEKGVEIFYFGIMYLVFQSILFFTLWNTEKIKNKIGTYIMFLTPPLLGVFSILAILLFPIKPVLIVGTIILFSIGTVRDPIFLTQIQLRIKSFNRATTTSALNVIKSTVEIPILLFVSYLVNKNINYAFDISLVIFIAVLLFANIKKEDILEETRENYILDS